MTSMKERREQAAIEKDKEAVHLVQLQGVRNELRACMEHLESQKQENARLRYDNRTLLERVASLRGALIVSAGLAKTDEVDPGGKQQWT